MRIARSLLILVVIVGVPVTTFHAGEFDSADAWAGSQYSRALREIFPQTVKGLHHQDQEVFYWSISVVLSPDGVYLDDPERQLVLTKFPDGRIVAIHRSIKGRRLGEQLARARRADPSIELVEVLTKVRLRESQTDDTECPGLGDLARALENLTIPVLPQSGIVIHGTGLFVTLRTSGSSTDRTLTIVRDDTHPLSIWITRAETVVDACTR